MRELKGKYLGARPIRNIFEINNIQ